MLRTTATSYGLKTVGDLRKVPDLTLAAFPEFETRWLPQLASRYGVRNVEFTPLAGISAYTLLSQGKVQAAGIFTTDPQLISTKYVVLKEPRNMFGFQQVAPVLSKKLVTENGTRLTATLNRVNALLTPAGDDRDEQGRRARQEVGRLGGQGLPQGQQADVVAPVRGRPEGRPRGRRAESIR